MPYNEHVATIQPRRDGLKLKRTRGSGGQKIAGAVIPENVAVFWDYDGSRGEPTEIRFPINEYSEDQARSWLVENRVKYDGFVPAEDAPKSCCTMVMNEASDTLKIDFDGFIGDEWEENDSNSFKKTLKNAGSPSTIDVSINSQGGYHYQGVAIHNALKEHPAKIITRNLGIAASSAATIYAAGDIRVAHSNTSFMIHKPAIPFMMNADADEMRKQAKNLDFVQDSVVQSLKGVINNNEAEINKMLNAETWFTAKTALDAGLVTEVAGDVEIDNYHELKELNYKKIPVNVLNLHDVNHGPKELDFAVNIETENGFNKLLNKLKSHFKPIEQEPENMDLKEMEKIVTGLNESVNTLTASNETIIAENASLKAENASLTAAVSQVTATLNNQAVNTRTDGYRTFCNDLVKQGRVLPAHVDGHVNTMDLKYQADEKEFTAEAKETPALDAFKGFLSALPVSIPINERHVANKDGAPPPAKKLSDDVVEAAINKIMEEKKLDYRNAMELYVKDTPEAANYFADLGDEE